MNINNVICIFLIIGNFYANICMAKIITTNDFKTIEDNINLATTDSLVVFDINNVLIKAKDSSVRDYYEIQAIKEQEKMLTKMQFELTDPRMVELISNLQQTTVKVLALTARYPDKMENFTIQQLQQFGYHFEKSWPILNNHIFAQILPRVSERFPVFNQGVILADGFSKGSVLEAFLNYIKWDPKEIIFIDDRRENLESVGALANKNNFTFLGIEYIVAKKYRPKKKVFFICMGNYYRSRLAEELLSYYSDKHNLLIEVDSCGINKIPNPNNPGTISTYALKYLNKLNIFPKNANRLPKSCNFKDLESANYIICMQEEQQRKLFEAAFPNLKSRVLYWNIPDITDDSNLESLHLEVKNFINKLLNDS